MDPTDSKKEIELLKIDLNPHVEPSFENDKLGIKPQHDNILRLIKGIDGKGTITVSAPYGGGKTFIAKCLETTLKAEENIIPVYVDLWKNDYKHPLVTFISALSDEKNDKLVEDVKTKVKAFFSLLGIGVTACTQVPTGDIVKLVNNMIDGKDKKPIKDLRDSIKELTKNQKLVFLIDEIDRCKPEYAVEMLETIKHFFEIDKVIFILFVNPCYVSNLESKYLGYGIDNHGYIEKFVDKKISLNITSEQYLNLLSIEDMNYHDNNIGKLIEYFSLKPRNILKIANSIKTFYKLYPKFDIQGYPDNYFYTFLMYTLKTKKPEDFNKITINHNAKCLSEIVEKLFPDTQQAIKCINDNRKTYPQVIKDCKNDEARLFELLSKLITTINWLNPTYKGENNDYINHVEIFSDDKPYAVASHTIKNIIKEQELTIKDRYCYRQALLEWLEALHY